YSQSSFFTSISQVDIIGFGSLGDTYGRKAAVAYRLESDTIGQVQVPADRYWGAQTQRSLENFKIGGHRFSPAMIRAFGIVKKAAALTNKDLGKLDAEKCDLMTRACDEVIAGKLDDHFPLVVW